MGGCALWPQRRTATGYLLLGRSSFDMLLQHVAGVDGPLDPGPSGSCSITTTAEC